MMATTNTTMKMTSEMVPIRAIVTAIATVRVGEVFLFPLRSESALLALLVVKTPPLGVIGIPRTKTNGKKVVSYTASV